MGPCTAHLELQTYVSIGCEHNPLINLFDLFLREGLTPY